MDALVQGVPGSVSGLRDLIERMERDEFDLIAVGRALIANPDWADKLRTGGVSDLVPFSRAMLARLD